MSALAADVRFAVRMLWKDRRFTFVALLALGLGIGATTAIYTVVDAVLLRPLPFADPERLVAVASTLHGRPNASSFPDYVDFRERNHVLAGLAAYTEADVVVTGNDDPRHLEALSVTPDLFTVLGVPPLLGRAFSASDAVAGSQSVIITHELWQGRYHGDPEILGRTLMLDGKVAVVIGVMPPGFTFPLDGDLAPQLYLPFPREPSDKTALEIRGMHMFRLVGRLQPGVPVARATGDFAALVDVMRGEHTGDAEDKYLGVQISPLHEAITGNLRPALLLLLAAVACVLLIACVNVAGLLLARGTVRQREVAIRTSLGATRARIVRQLLTESALLGLLGGGLGLLLAMWLVDFLLALVAPQLPRVHVVAIDGRVLAVTLGVSILSSLAFGLVPALHASRTDLQEALKESARSTSPRSRRSRNALLVVELAVALVLLFGAGLALRSFARLRAVAPGFDARDLVVAQVELPPARYPDDGDTVRYYRALVEAVQRLPGVEAFGVGAPLPFSRSGVRTGIHLPGQPADLRQPHARVQTIGPGYLQAMHIPLLRGRDLTTTDDQKNAAPVVLVSETLVNRLFPDLDPIGKHLVVGLRAWDQQPDGTDCEIVGVVGDIRRDNLAAPPQASIYLPMGRIPLGIVSVAVRTRAPAAMLPALRQAALWVDKELPPTQLATMDSLMSDTLHNQRALLLLLGLFAATALLLASIGIYGVMSYTVTQRQREIGIRVAVGASVPQVLRLILGGSLRLALLGVALGVAAALALAHLARSLLFGVTAADPLTLVVVAGLLLLVALLATLVPAWRASRVDPMVALRDD